jgi:hypothetical protein
MSAESHKFSPTHREEFIARHESSLFKLGRVIWILLAVLTIGVYTAALPSHWTELSTRGSYFDMSLGQIGFSVNFYAIYTLGIQAITIFIYAITALVIFFARSNNRMTLLISFGLLTIGTAAYPTLNIFSEAHPQWRIPVIIIQAVGLGSMLLVFYLFPDGRFVPKWTRPLAVIWVIWVLFWVSSPTTLTLSGENLPTSLKMMWTMVFRINPERIANWYNQVRLYSLGAILTIWISSGIFAQVFRYRHISTPAEKQQSKWVVFGLSAAAIGYLVVVLIFGPPSEIHPGTMGIIFALASNTLISICLILVPLTIGSSILRFRLWDVDFLINQTLVYSALTLFVSLFYVADVFILQAIFRAVTGRTSDVAIVVTTLLIALLFQPLRHRMQNFVDKMFFREKVDFRQAFTDFSIEIRTIIELPELLNVLIGRVTNLLHVQHGAVYLYTPEKKFKLAESINLNSNDAAQLPLDANTLQHLQTSTAVVTDAHPIFKILVPLMAPRAADNPFIGILALGPRLSGQSYGREDRALLYTLTDQAGTAIHVAQLIQEKQAEIQRREAAERSLEIYRNSPAGQAESIATVIKDHPKFAIGGLYHIAQYAGSNPQIANVLDNLPQAFERLQSVNLADLARAIDYIFTSQWTPALLIVGLRRITALLEDQHADFINGAQVLRMYRLFLRALEANSIYQIIELGEDPDWDCVLEESTLPKIPAEILSNFPAELLPSESDLQVNPSNYAVKAIPTLIEGLKSFQRVDTSRDQLAYLAASVERLRHIEHKARTGPSSPERPIVMQISESWLAVVTSAMTELQTRAQIICQLLTRNTWRNDIITIVLAVCNDGRGAALNVQVTLAPAKEYTLINASQTIPRLAPGEEAQVQLRIRPRLDQGIDQLRARFVIRFTDPRGPDQIENFADVVHLLTTGGDFQYISNPYVVGTPLQMGSPLFFGRADDIRYINENLSALHRNNLVLIGQRRTGKTSLLKQLPAHLGDEYLPVYLDGQSLGLDPGLQNFFLNIATEISFVLEDRGFEVAYPEPEEFTDSPATVFEKGFLQQVRAVIGDRHLLILLDEFEELEAAIQRGNLDASIFSFLRHIIQHTDNLSVIFCGTHRIEELAADYWSILFNISLYRSVGFLEKEEAFHLIQEPVKSHNMRYDDLALDKIWRISAGHPYFLQLLCHSLVNWHNKTERNYVTISDVNAAMDEILASGEAHFVYLWTEATPVDRLVLTTMSRMIPLTGHVSALQIHDYLNERGVTIERRAIQEALHRLALREVLASHEDLEGGIGEVYHWKLGLLGMWVEKYKSMSRVMDEFTES